MFNPDVFDKLPAGDKLDCPVMISTHSSFSSGKFISKILWDTMVTFAAKSIAQATLAKMVNRAYMEQYWDDRMRYNTWRADNGLTKQVLDRAAAAAAAAQATADLAAAASVAASSATAEAEAERATAAAARAGATTAKALPSFPVFRNKQPAQQQAAASAKDFVYRSPPQSDFGEYGDKNGYAGLSISGALLNNILKGGAWRRELHTRHQRGIVASVVSLDWNFQLAKHMRVGRGKQSHQAACLAGNEFSQCLGFWYVAQGESYNEMGPHLLRLVLRCVENHDKVCVHPDCMLFLWPESSS